ncbi:hypothetical protein UFOVP105_26 [uncultured Caudovirales phage]|uniref:Uncharacterized protein n=1 Tax=uncultured Caudovirales phage TaxID=2100421 RepID=A0A6J5L4M3_9CAUD|nr:hypothetical protein UFOVP105_26 [uncultured Caudovirales phage]
MNKQIFIDIRDRVKTNNLIKHVALYNSQYKHENVEKVFNFPAVFIEFSRVDYRAETVGVSKIDFEITLHICFNQYVEDLALFDIVQSTILTVNKWGTDDFTPLQIISEEHDTDHDNTSAWKVLFKCTATDDNTADAKKLVLAGSPRTLELTTDLDIDNLIVRTGDGKN